MISHFLNILFSGLALGGAVIARYFLNPRSLEDSAEHYVNFHQQILNPIDRYLLILSGLAALVAVRVLVHHHVWVYLPTKLMLEGLICAGIAMTLLIMGIRPIDRKFAAWQADHLPEEWRDRRAQWLRLHTIQSVFSFLAFGFYLLAALVAKSN